MDRKYKFLCIILMVARVSTRESTLNDQFDKIILSPVADSLYLISATWYSEHMNETAMVIEMPFQCLDTMGSHLRNLMKLI